MESMGAENKLLAEIRSLRGDIRVMHTKMFGAEDQEMSQGRMPRLEASIAEHEDRIDRLEHLTWAARGIAWLSGLVSGALAVWYHFLRLGGHN